MDTTDVLTKNILTSLSADTDVSQIADDLWAVGLPFLLADGNYVVIYVKRNERGYKVTDMGDMFATPHMSLDPSKQQEIRDYINEQGKYELSDSDEIYRYSDNARLVPTIKNMALELVNISHM